MNQDLIETCKKKAAEKAVQDNVKENMILGIGSGSTIVYAVQKIAEMDKKTSLNLKCVPTSYQSAQLILANDLKLVSLDQYPEIDLDLDGADEIDKDLNLIKGGGGCLVQEKIIATNSKKIIVISDFRKRSEILGTNWKNGLPIEIIPLAYRPLMKKLTNLGGKPRLRMARAKFGPLITDNGNFIIDVDFGVIKDPSQLDKKLKVLSGVVDTGLFVNMASKAYIGAQDGSVLVLEK